MRWVELYEYPVREKVIQLHFPQRPRIFCSEVHSFPALHEKILSPENNVKYELSALERPRRQPI